MQTCRENIHECKEINSEPNRDLGNEARQRKVELMVCCVAVSLLIERRPRLQTN